MALQDRFDALEPRERRLVLILVGIFLALLVFLIPVGVSALLREQTETRARLTEAIERIETEGDEIRERQAERAALLARYEAPAPGLAGYLDKAATASGLAIPEIKDQSPVAHGKRYEERSTAISFRKTGLLALVKFMERVSGSADPISITKLNIRKRPTEPDTYDVQMTVAAYHRLQPQVKVEEEEP